MELIGYLRVLQGKLAMIAASAIVAPIAFATVVHHASWRLAFALAALSPLVGYALLSPLAERRP